MSFSSIKRRLQDTRGSNLVEFSIVALVLFGTMLGMIDLCRLVFAYTTIANAARAGMRYAIVHGADRTGTGINGPSSSTNYYEVTNIANNYFQLIDYRSRRNLRNGCSTRRTSIPCVEVDYLDGGNTVGSRVRVAVRYPYNPLTVFLLTNGGSFWTIDSTSEGVITF